MDERQMKALEIEALAYLYTPIPELPARAARPRQRLLERLAIAGAIAAVAVAATLLLRLMA
jgi:hypothetical protein